MKWTEVTADAQEYADTQMRAYGEGWDRNDPTLIGVFYKHYIDQIEHWYHTASESTTPEREREEFIDKVVDYVVNEVIGYQWNNGVKLSDFMRQRWPSTSTPKP